MPMTLTGTGTIAGLQAGGLPDASVTAADLAVGAARSNFGAGAVLQVVATNDSTQRSTSNSSFTASGMSVTITPSLTSSKVLVMFSTNIYKNADATGYITIFRNGSTNLAGSGSQMNLTNVVDRYVPCSILYLDSPASTSALTYEVYYARSGTANIYINATNSGVTMGSITAMEIAG